LAEYSELYKKLGGYLYDRDPKRPAWFPIMPGNEYAQPPR